MSAFFESLHRQANNLQSIEEQRAFYEQQASSLPAGYAYGYDSAVHLEELASSGDSALAMPTFLHEQDGSLQGFLDYLAVPSRNDLHIATFVIKHALKPEVVQLDCAEQLSPIDTIVLHALRKVPLFPAMRVVFYRTRSVAPAQQMAA